MGRATPTGHDHLPADTREGIMVDPHAICIVQGECITAPDHTGVDVRQGQVTHDDIVCAAPDKQPHALNTGTGTYSQ